MKEGVKIKGRAGETVRERCIEMPYGVMFSFYNMQPFAIFASTAYFIICMTTGTSQIHRTEQEQIVSTKP